MSQSVVQAYGASQTAAGTTAAAATAIPAGQLASHFGTVTAAAGACSLPNIPFVFPSLMHICNHGSANLLVYPSNTGVTEGTIDGRAAGVCTYVAPGASILLAAMGAGTATVGARWMTLGYSGPRPIRSITGTTTLTLWDTNTTFLVSQAAAYTITLPAVASSVGCDYEFELDAKAANLVQISSDAANMYGFAMVGPRAGVTVQGTNAAATQTVRFSTTCENGDRIRVRGNGVSYNVQGHSLSNVAATGIIFA